MDEREANVFAMELLMPRDWILRDVETYREQAGNDSERLVEILAKRYEVSAFVMTMRLTSLGVFNV